MMVCLFSFIRSLLGSRKKQIPSLLPPPPEYVAVCPDKVSEKGELISEHTLLNPRLHFTANDLEVHLAGKDANFAAAVVELMLPRLKLGVWQEPVGWGHYSYTLDKVFRCATTHANDFQQKDAGCHSDACQCNKATGWDAIIGFKAWEYSSRFKQVAELAKRDLELRGFEVERIEVYTHKCALKNCRGGVFVKWDIRFPGDEEARVPQKQTGDENQEWSSHRHHM
jgi:hypothetical protein